MSVFFFQWHYWLQLFSLWNALNSVIPLYRSYWYQQLCGVTHSHSICKRFTRMISIIKCLTTKKPTQPDMWYHFWMLLIHTCLGVNRALNPACYRLTWIVSIALVRTGCLKDWCHGTWVVQLESKWRLRAHPPPSPMYNPFLAGAGKPPSVS